MWPTIPHITRHVAEDVIPQVVCETTRPVVPYITTRVLSPVLSRETRVTNRRLLPLTGVSPAISPRRRTAKLVS